MAARQRPVLLATRVTELEAKTVRAAADLEGKNLQQFTHEIILAEVGRRLRAYSRAVAPEIG